MKKNLIQALLATLIIALGIFLFYKFQSRPTSNPLADYSNKLHSNLYTQAQNLWDAQIAILPFRPQTVGDQTIGSARGVRIEWKAPEQSFNHFVITITQPESGWSRTEAREHDGISLDLTDLIPDTKYVLGLQACLDRICSTWMMAEQEPSARTQRIYLQKTDDAIDPTQSNIHTQDKLSEEITSASMVFLNEDGTPTNDEQKNQLTFGAVFVDQKTNQSYLQIHRGDSNEVMRLLNP